MKETNALIHEEESLAIVKAVCSSDTQERRGKLHALEMALLQNEQAEIPVKHRFNGGIYAREITIPEGTLLTGRIHKFDHFDIMLSGDVTVSTDSGEVKRLTGLNILEGKAGKKRAGYAHKDTHWITFHCAEERNPEEMYNFLTCGSFEELEEFNLMLSSAMSQMEHDEKVLVEHAKYLQSKGEECQ